MKHKTRILAGFLAALSCTGVLGSTAYAEPESVTAYILGDFNDDGAVDVTDAQLVLQAYTDQLAELVSPLNEWQMKVSDVDGSQAVDVTDAQFILNFYVANTVLEIPTTWEEITAVESAFETATMLMSQFMTAYMEEEWQSVIEMSDVQAMLTLMQGKIVTNEEIIEDLNEEGPSKQTILSFEISEGKEEPELMEKCNKYLEELRASAAEAMAAGVQDENGQPEEAMTAEEYAALEFVLPYFEPVTDLYSFEISVNIRTVRTAADESGIVKEETTESTETDTLYVFRSGGKWNVDIGAIRLGIALMEASERTEINRAARTVYNAYNSALCDLDTQGVNVTMYDGTHILPAALYQNLTPNETEPGAQLRYLAAQYAPEIAEYKEIAFYIKDGCCVCTAVSIEKDGELKYSLYPIRDDGNDNAFASIEEAIEAEKRLYAEQYGD